MKEAAQTMVILLLLILNPLLHGKGGVNSLALPSCQSYYNVGVRESGTFAINPDGPGNNSPFPVHCNFTSNVVETVVHHDKIGRFQSPRSYESNNRAPVMITYTQSSWSQVRGVVTSSQFCSYSFKYECKFVVMQNHLRFMAYDGVIYRNWWKTYGGLCHSIYKNCTCDKNDGVWREEVGSIAIKEAFPIVQLRIGDTDDASLERSYHTLGPLVCNGTESPCENNPCGSGICLPGSNYFVCVCDKDDLCQHDIRGFGLKFDKKESHKYSGPGEITSLSTCSTNECYLLCLRHLTKCRGMNIALANGCRCVLLDDNVMTNTNVVQDAGWSFYKMYF